MIRIKTVYYLICFLDHVKNYAVSKTCIGCVKKNAVSGSTVWL